MWLILIIVIVLIILIIQMKPVENMTNISTIKIYVINLKDRPDRKKNIIDELKKNNLYQNAIFTEAVNGQQLNIQELTDNNIIAINNKMRKGELGCYISHINCWNEILKGNDEIALVIEDDVMFNKDFIKQYQEILNKLSSLDWDIFCLGRNCMGRVEFDDSCIKGKYIDNNILVPKTIGFCTFAYTIKKSCIKKLKNHFFPIKDPIDVLLLNHHKNGNIQMVGLVKNIVKIRNYSDSDTINIV